MSTRANVIIKDSHDKLFFYRHSDGYPSGTMPTLNIFLDWLKSGKIRDNISQAAGWLVVIGAVEYGTIPAFTSKEALYPGGKEKGDISTMGTPSDWKASAYEPTIGIHGDIEYLYIIDLDSKSVKCYEEWTESGIGVKEADLSDIEG